MGVLDDEDRVVDTVDDKIKIVDPAEEIEKLIDEKKKKLWMLFLISKGSDSCQQTQAIGRKTKKIVPVQERERCQYWRKIWAHIIFMLFKTVIAMKQSPDIIKVDEYALKQLTIMSVL